eukprot:TRINITY_DN1003_c0_g1_i1.p1 TRINITY_DN1003_c0_g1~~TRINITY_DN1003_c0_g1_i1.p1  ORF type:complete len:601 (-),score=143.31 TRINITY_DN1003_c0_g1_i1:93-1895(-)
MSWHKDWKLTATVNDLSIVFDMDNQATKETKVSFCGINRKTGKLVNNPTLQPGKSLSVSGIIGVINLLAGPYLVVVESSKKVGSVFGRDIFSITKVELIAVARRTLSSGTESSSENEYVSMLQKLLSDGSFYYSHDYDLTNSLQRQSVPNFQKDSRFDWAEGLRKNFFNLTKSEDEQINDWCVTIIRGFVTISPDVAVGSNKVDYILISRSSKERAGRRYTRRGANLQGQVVNYVESEQIIISSKSSSQTVTSYVQVRGSIPLLWTQHANVNYEPSIKLKPVTNNTQNVVLKSHFSNQIELYSRQTVVSLIKNKGNEGKLAEPFAKLINIGRDKNLSFIAFDLHKEVGHSKFQNLKKLWDQTDNSLSSYKFYGAGSKGESCKQTGVMRTNCKDNLDRTNLVQTHFATDIAWKQVEFLLNTTKDSFTADETALLGKVIRIAWADNGDAVSVQYAGTPAMRSDHIRSGKSTYYGMFNDALNSVTRYYINNYEDGRIQDSLDLLLQKRTPVNDYVKRAPPVGDKNKIILLLSSIFSYVFKLLQPRSRDGIYLILCILWMLSVFFFWKVLFLDPSAIVDYQRLPRSPKKPTKEDDIVEIRQKID